MGWHGFARMLTEVAGSLRDVLLPRGCAGCDMPDAVLCDDCRASGGGFMSFAMPGTVSGRAIACGAILVFYKDAPYRGVHETLKSTIFRRHSDIGPGCSDPVF